jgi:hypothetical protein
MKRLKSGVVNTLSFVKTADYISNDFSITLEKIVGSGYLTLENLEDNRNLDVCSDFISLNVDLITNELDGGEYFLYLTHGTSTQKYLADVQSYQYNTLGSSIYADSVVLSNEVTSSGGSTNDGDTTNSGTNTGTVSFSIELRDNNYGTMSSPYYVRNTFFIQALASNIHQSITDIKAILTDSDGNQISKTTTVTDYSVQPLSIEFPNEQINYGDIATFVYEGLDSNGDVVYTSSTYDAVIPPKIELFIAESEADAELQRTNGETGIKQYNGDTTSYNLYAYLYSNKSATITLDSTTTQNNFVLANTVGGTILDNPYTITPTQGSMYLVDSDVIPSWTSETMLRTIKFYTRYEWTGGYSTPLLNNIPNLYNFFHYGEISNQMTQMAYAEESIVVNGTTITLEGFSPILYHSHQFSGNDLVLKLGDGSFALNANYINGIAVIQDYSDSTYEEWIISKTEITNNSLAIGGMVGDSYDLYVKVLSPQQSKTITQTKLWVDYGGYWFNVDNNSVDKPHFLV